MKNISFYLFFLLIVFSSKSSHSQIVINEISNANGSVYFDEDGENTDWIELYNSGSTKVSLANYALTDDSVNLRKWVFPDLEIAPQSYLLLFASGKDSSTQLKVNHWETVVYNTDTWNYLVGTAEPDSNWIDINYNSGSWLSGSGGFGFGDGDDNTVIPQTSSVYIRKEFNIVDTSIIETALLHMDYDDGFVAYLNGVEIARIGIGTKGTRPSHNELSSGSREAKMYLGLAPEAFTISKKMLNELKPGKNVLCIQVHNFSTTSADLSSSAFLSLGITDASKHYGPVPSWFNLNSDSRHTNFKISPNGEKLLLSNGNGNIIDSYALGNLQNNHSVGRKPDGSNNWCLFNTPSPDSSNNNSACYDGYEPDPIF